MQSRYLFFCEEKGKDPMMGIYVYLGVLRTMSNIYLLDFVSFAKGRGLKN